MDTRGEEAELSLAQEYYLRKMIRHDVKIIQKLEDKEHNVDNSDNEGDFEEKINFKVQYGTDTDSELEEAFQIEIDKREAIY